MPPNILRAAYSGQLPCVKALLCAGAEPSASDASFLDMKTPLHKAVDQGHEDVSIALLEAGANPNACDAAGNSPMDIVVLSSPPAASGSSDIQRTDSARLGAGASDSCDVSHTGQERCGFSVQANEKDWSRLREVLERYGARCCRDSSSKDSSGGFNGSVDVAQVAGVSGEHESWRQPVQTRSSNNGADDLDENKAKYSIIVDALSSRTTVFVDPKTESGCCPSDAGAGDNDFPAEVARKKKNNILAIDQSADVTPATLPLKHQTDAFTHDGDGAGRGPIDTAQSEAGEGGSGGSVGVPCGECRLPKVVMVRASCCGGLLCKHCIRDISIRRCKCRRCRGLTIDSGT